MRRKGECVTDCCKTQMLNGCFCFFCYSLMALGDWIDESDECCRNGDLWIECSLLLVAVATVVDCTIMNDRIRLYVS